MPTTSTTFKIKKKIDALEDALREEYGKDNFSFFIFARGFTLAQKRMHYGNDIEPSTEQFVRKK